MAAYIRQEPPRWFLIVAVLLVVWGAIGVFAFYRDVTSDVSPVSAMPTWFPWVYGAATWAGLFGALALASRRKLSRAFFAVSLAALLIQFGWVFIATDMIREKGAGTVVPFPLFIIGVAIFQLWFAVRARRRGWLH